jgi:hypothetical protein
MQPNKMLRVQRLRGRPAGRRRHGHHRQLASRARRAQRDAPRKAAAAAQQLAQLRAQRDVHRARQAHARQRPRLAAQQGQRATQLGGALLGVRPHAADARAGGGGGGGDAAGVGDAAGAKRRRDAAALHLLATRRISTTHCKMVPGIIERGGCPGMLREDALAQNARGN